MTDVDEVLARADAWQHYLEARDVEGIQQFLDDDYALVLVVPASVTISRAEWLHLLPDYVVHSWQVNARIAHVNGDVAAVLTDGTQAATVAGNDRSGRFILTDTWRRDSDRQWRVWRRHSTPMSAGTMPRAD